MFSFQKRGETTTASGLEAGATLPAEGSTNEHDASSEAFTMAVVHGNQANQAYAQINADTCGNMQGNEEGQQVVHDSLDGAAAHYVPPLQQQEQLQEYGNHYNDYYASAQQQEDPSAVDATSYPGHSDVPRSPQQQEHGGNGREEEEVDMGEGQLFTDYHGSTDRNEAHNRRLQQQKMYDDVPVPPDDADPHTVFTYYRKLIGLVQLVPPKHWREIRFDLPANVAELQLYPQRRERIQDREPIRPSSTVVISLEGTLPEGTTPSEYAAQMVQYLFDLLQYQNASTAITTLRFVKKEKELSQMVVTFGRDSRLAGRILTELQAAGLRAHYGMIIFEHPPNATFQVVDYRRTLHGGKGISSEDVLFLLEPFRKTKTVDINVVEGYEPGVFYVPVKRPEAVYAFLWNYFCSFKFQADLFRRYGVLVTQASCKHEFLQKGIPYFVQKRELEERKKAELMRIGFQEREGGVDRSGRTGVDEEDDSDLDEEAVASGEGPPPAWVTTAVDEIDIFSGLTKTAPKTALSDHAVNEAEKKADLFSADIYTDKTLSPAANAATSALVDDEEGITDIDALLKQYNAVAAKPSKKHDAAVRNRRGKDAAAGEIVSPPPPPIDAPPYSMGGGDYGWVDPRQQQPQQLPPPMSSGGAYGEGPFGDPYHNASSGAVQDGGYRPFPPTPGVNTVAPPQPYYRPPFPLPPSTTQDRYGAYPDPSGPTPFGALRSEFVAPPPATDYLQLVTESDDDEENETLSHDKRQPQGGMESNSVGMSGSTVLHGKGSSLGLCGPQLQHPQQQSSASSFASPYGKEELLSWSMDEAQPSQRSGGANNSNLNCWQQSDGRDAWGNIYSPPPQQRNTEGETNNNSSVDGGGGAGVLGDYDPSLDTPFFNVDHTMGNVAGYPPPQQGWEMQGPMMMTAMVGSDDMNSGSYNDGSYGYGYAPEWNQEGFPQQTGGGGGLENENYLPQQQQQIMYIPPPPHVSEAAQITEDLEERIQAAFPAAWAAATAADVPPFPLDGEAELDKIVAAEAKNENAMSDYVLQHVSVELASKNIPPPNTEMEELFQFLHRNVGLIGRLLHKTTTTTVEQANDVAVYRSRVARALLIGATADTEEKAWSMAWVQQPVDGGIVTADSAVLKSEADAEGEPKSPADRSSAVEGDGKDKMLDEQQQEEEVDIEYQLPALLPYLLRIPAGVDLAMLLAFHYPHAFARRFLPYAPAYLIEERVVRVVLATVLRRDQRSNAPLVRSLFAHWFPLLRWLKNFVDVKATVGEVATQSDGGEQRAASSKNANASAVKQLVSLLGNTMDVVLANLSPDQREVCYACSKDHDYVNAFVDALGLLSSDIPSPEANTPANEMVLPQLWGLDGALYRSLLRLYIAADACDAATLAKRVLTRTASSADATSNVFVRRDHFYYCLNVLSRSQTAPVLSREAAAFCGAFLCLVELQQTEEQRRSGSSTAAAVADAESKQLLETALKALQTNEAYTALRNAYLDVSGPITRVEAVFAQLSSAEPPATVALRGSTYREWYANTNQQQRINAEAAKIPSTFYYQPPSRRNMNNNSSKPRWIRNYEACSNQSGGESWAHPQPPVWASAPGQRTGGNNSSASGGGVLSQRGSTSRGISIAAHQWRVEWTETMRSYPASGTPFLSAMPEGWTCSLSRNFGRYCFSKAFESSSNATVTNTSAAAESEDARLSAAAASSSLTTAGPSSTYKHPADGKEYLVTPQAFLQEPGATAEVTAMQVCDKANTLHREEALASGLPPPAELTQADLETWLADQRHRNVFLDVAAMELLGICYRTIGSEQSTPAAGALKHGRERPTAALKALTPQEQQELLQKIIPSSYPAVGAPYPALFPSWSVYFNSARGQYGFSGPHHGRSQPPLFIHPSTRKHYFISPQAFVRQRKVNYDAIAREAKVDTAEVERWMTDQRIRDTAIDAAVIKIVSIHYADVDKALADNAAAVATNADEAAKKDHSSTPTAPATTNRERERNATAVATSSATTRHRSEKGGDGRSRREERPNSSSRRRRRRRSDSDSDDYSYSDDGDDDDYRRRGPRKGRSLRRRGGGGGRGRRRR